VKTTNPYTLVAIIDKIATTVADHNLGTPGQYRRLVAGKLDPYGCADAANILYTIGRFPADAAERAQWVATLQSFQNPDDGLFHDPTHHPFHTTAHCIAALELFEARPLHPLRGMAHLAEKDALIAFLDQLDWRNDPWSQSHQGAGVYAARVLAGEATAEWEDWYFDWLWEQADWQTGMWRHGCIGNVGELGQFPHLAGTFHYLFNHEYARRRLRFPTALLDSCLRIQKETIWPKLGKQISFMEIDWVYCLSRALRQGGDKFRTGKHALAAFLDEYYWFLRRLDTAACEPWHDLHLLFGMVCCLAELQQALPGTFRTQRPLRLVLDRRPFI
jgi:hypothetical protein